jgi:eukaryotic-like serine/threonine-protein kinase
VETTTPNSGDVLDERFVVEGTLGKGGMGVVYRVRQGDEHYALKLIRPERAQSAVAARRMAREAEVLQSIDSPHVARIIETGELDGSAYLLMDLVEGETLRQRLATGTSLDVGGACSIVVQAAAALAPAHAAGIVHRDLKPSNLMLGERDDELWLTVLDFGIAKVLTTGLDDPTLTATGSTMGSPRYMSPEQLRDTKAVDARSDIWALGVVLYEMLAGRPPFEAPSHEALCLAIGMDAHAPLEGFPDALAAVVDRCLKKDCIDRYVNVAELARALLPFAPASAATLAAEASAVFDAGEITETTEEPGDTSEPAAADEPKPRWWWWGAAGVAAVAVLLAARTTPTAPAVTQDPAADAAAAPTLPPDAPIPAAPAPAAADPAPVGSATTEPTTSNTVAPSSSAPTTVAGGSPAPRTPSTPAIVAPPRPVAPPEMRDDPLDDRR